MEQKLALVGGVIPGVIAGVAMLLGWVRYARWVKQDAGGEGATGDSTRGVGPVWIAPLVIAVGYLLGDFTTNGWPELWPDANNYRYVHAVFAVCALGLVEALVRLPVLAAVAARALAFGGVYWMLVEGYHAVGTVATDDFYGWMGVVALGGAGVATALDRGLATLTGWRGAGLMIVVFACAGAILFLGDLSYAIHGATPMIAVMSATLVVSFFAKQVHLDRGAATALTGVLLALVLGAGFQTEPVSPPGLVLLAGAPAALVAALACSCRTRGFAVALVALVMVLAASGGATWLAQPQVDPNDPYAGY